MRRQKEAVRVYILKIVGKIGMCQDPRRDRLFVRENLADIIHHRHRPLADQ